MPQSKKKKHKIRTGMNPYEEDSSSEEIKKKLYRNAMKRDWQSVVTIYKEDPNAHTAKITESGDTALHIAIFDGQEDIVEELVSIIHDAKTPGALEIQNELGNTPLHLASYLGHIGMCFFIARENSKLMGIRNKAKETPFFLAVLHGRKDVFLCLHSLCKEPREGYNYCRKDKGETMLHSAITGEYFDLAFQIICLYPELQNSVDEQGITPLHLLASKPSAFRSGSRLRGFYKLIHHCVYVKKLKRSVIPFQGRRDENNAENSQASFGLTRWLGKITRLPMGRHRVQKMDAEDPNGQQLDHQQQAGSSKITYGSKGLGLDFGPKKASTHFRGLKLLFKAMLVFLLGSFQIRKIQEEKKKHIWSVQIMDILVEHSSSYRYAYRRRPRTSEAKGDRETAPYAFSYGENVGFKPGISTDQLEPVVDYDYSRPPLADNSLEALQSNKEERKQGIIGNEKKRKAMENEKKESPLLIAAKHGILEMVEKILQTFPVAIHDMNTDEKNIVLLAVENRQPHVYQFLLNQKILKETIFYKRDKYGNSALHLAAMLGDKQPWLIPGPALQMQWEVKWYEFVENSMPFNFFVRYNYNGQTPWDIFSSTHQKLVKDAGKWLSSTSQSCSVVATLIATVAFTASATVPGGLKSETGIPVLEKEPAFSIFAISTLIALCFSISSVVMFLVFFTRYHEKDFGMNLPAKLLVELASLLISIAAVLVSFCAAHFFVIKDKLKYTALPLYAVTLLPVALYAFWQFPMYIELAVATFKKEPQRIYE